MFAVIKTGGKQYRVAAEDVLKVEKIAGDIKPGGTLVGRITGSRSSGGRPYAWDLAFDVKLPAKDAAGGVMCGK